MPTIDRRIKGYARPADARKPSRIEVNMRTLFALVLLPAAAVAAENDSKPRVSVTKMKQDAPAARFMAAAAFDTKRGRMIVFGQARPNEKDASGDLLALDMKTDSWSTVEVGGPHPQGVGGAGMVYVEKEDALYLFGGWPAEAAKPLAELWKLPLGEEKGLRWRLVSDGGKGPPERNGCCLVVDAKRNRLILHGGDGGPHPVRGFTPLDDLWSFDLASKNWRKLMPKGRAPEPRWNHATAVDPERSVMYIFGGVGYVKTRLVADRDIHVLDLGSLKWTRLTSARDRPWAMMGTSLTFDSASRLLLVAGGLSLDTRGPPGPLCVWTFDIDAETWVKHEKALLATRRDHVGVYDSRGNRHIIFGGMLVKEPGNFYARSKVLANALAITIENE